MGRFRILMLAGAVAATVAAADSRVAAPPLEIVARVGGQSLPGERLAAMLALSQLPLQRDYAAVIVDLWVNYQLIAMAGAHAESLSDTTMIDRAMWSTLDSARASKLYELLEQSVPPIDTTNLEAKYAQGELLAAQHILLSVPENASLQVQNRVQQRAETLLKKVTTANFKAMVTQYTDEPGGKEREGKLGVFAHGAMLPEFETAVRALRPGAIAPALVKTSYGFHIIRRQRLAEVRDEYLTQLQSKHIDSALARFAAKLEADSKLTVRPGSAPKAREVAKDPSAALEDKTVLATSTLGEFTAGSLAKWMLAFSEAERQRLKAEMAGSPDKTVELRVYAIAAKDLKIAEANRRMVKIDSADLTYIRGLFQQMVFSSSRGLNVEAATLAAQAASAAERERIASVRVDSALERTLATNGRTFVEIPAQLATALRRVYAWRVNTASLVPTVDRAKAIRLARDSLRAKGAQGGH